MKDFKVHYETTLDPYHDNELLLEEWEMVNEKTKSSLLVIDEINGGKYWFKNTSLFQQELIQKYEEEGFKNPYLKAKRELSDALCYAFNADQYFITVEISLSSISLYKDTVCSFFFHPDYDGNFEDFKNNQIDEYSEEEVYLKIAEENRIGMIIGLGGNP